MFKYYDLCFIIDVLKNKVTTPEINSLFQPREEHYDFRVFRPLLEETQRFDYTHEAPIHRIRRHWNKLTEEDRTIFLQESKKQCLKSKTLQFF